MTQKSLKIKEDDNLGNWTFYWSYIGGTNKRNNMTYRVHTKTLENKLGHCLIKLNL